MTRRRNAHQLVVLAGFLAGTIHFCYSQADPGRAAAQPAVSPLPSPPSVARLIAHVHTVGSARGEMRYREIWGIDQVKLQPTASGRLIRFSYRVLDPQKAQPLNDKKAEPYLQIDKTGEKLGVETGERVGKLRQVAEPESGREYWMMFGNAGHLVKPGDRVNIVIGSFHAYGLFVEPGDMPVGNGH